MKERDLRDYCRRNVDVFHYVAVLEKANMKDKPTLETRRQSSTENLSCIKHNPV